MTAEAFVQWARDEGIALWYIQPGKPNQNAFIERFNRGFRAEVLDAHLFASLDVVQDMADAWMSAYNEERSHESLGNVPPAVFLSQSVFNPQPLISNGRLDWEVNDTVQRIFQLKGCQVRKRPVGFRPRIEALPSVACAPNERWATDLCRIWAGRDGWATLALVMDCYSREVLGWHLSRSARSRTPEAALEQALIQRFGCLGRVSRPFLLRSDNGLVFTSRSYTALVKSYGLKQEFITPHSPEQNGMVERLIRTLKEQCVHRQRFESLQHASRVIGDWIGFYNHQRPHQALAMKTPAEAFALAA